MEPKSKTRQERIEDFLLNPDKVVFESIEELNDALSVLRETFAGIDLTQLEQLQGENGKTPVRGEDYFTDAEMNALQEFILERLPEAGEDFPSHEQVKAMVADIFATIPKPKDGAPGAKGAPGKDGSPDTPKDIVAKLRSLAKKDRLGVEHIRGMDTIIGKLKALSERVDNVADETGKQILAINPDGGAPTSHTHTASEITDFDTEVGNHPDVSANTGARHTHANQGTLDATEQPYTTAEQTKLGHISVTQAVDLDQMENDINALANGMVYQGNFDASSGSFPGAGSAQTGWFYTVSVAGTIDSIEFAVGDRLIATTDNASTTTYAGNWTKLDATDAVTTVAGRTGNVTLDADDVSETAGKKWASENGADVTDAGNVGSAIHGATAKTTPVDADTVALIDSASSNVLKKLSWSNIKATLKTYFDTLYEPVGGGGGGGVCQTLQWGGNWDGTSNYIRAQGDENTTDSSAINVTVKQPVLIDGTINTVGFVHNNSLSTNNATITIYVNETSQGSFTASAGAEGVDIGTSLNISVSAGDTVEIGTSGSTAPGISFLHAIVEGTS